ncbi:MAG TPA: mechanosensitive ion channel family protein [Steroidobacteraceae bacterium]|nr:mechanosensitive ion channel family protein [Steroidobacteraceae bacterium]
MRATQTIQAPQARWPRRGLALLALAVALPTLGLAQALPDLDPGPEPEPQPEPAVIEATDGAAPEDGDIEERLEGIFANLPGLESVDVSVTDGVILLEGIVPDQDSRERAAQLAERVRGSVAVVNEITRDRSIERRLAATSQRIETRFRELVGSAPVLLLALGVVLLALFLARLIARATWLFGRLSDNWFVRDLLRQIAQLAVTVTGVVIALQLLDAGALLGSLLGALGIVGLAIGFATRDTVENYIASILLSLRQPFGPHEHVSIEGVEGKVLRLTSRATVLMSLDGNHLRIPNAKVYKATIVNYTRNPLRRFEFDVGVDTDLDLALPRTVALETLAQMPGVAATPAPLCIVSALGESNVVLKVLAWVDQRTADFMKVRSEAQQAVKEAFDDAGIVMPEPIYNVNLRRRPHRAPKAAVEAPPAVPAAETRRKVDVLDTAPDHALDEQIRAERDIGEVQDLLDPKARSE